MKWIGQHIWDFISRFRSDVYLEATETGTIASGGNLGLDANNKIVKADAANKPLVYSEINITNTEMANLNSTRKTLVAAPGSSKMIVPVRAMILCSKLNGNAVNSTLTNLYMGYYHNDRRDITRLPVMQTLGLLHMRREPATYNMVTSTGGIYNIGIGYGENKELALALSVAPGTDGATTSKLQLLYYIADVI